MSSTVFSQVTTLRAVCNAFAELLLSLILVDHAIDAAVKDNQGPNRAGDTALVEGTADADDQDAVIQKKIGLLQAAATGARNVGTLASLLTGLLVYQCGSYVGLNAKLIIGITAVFAVASGVCALFLRDGPPAAVPTPAAAPTDDSMTSSPPKSKCRCSRRGLVALSLFLVLQLLVVVTIFRTSVMTDDDSSPSSSDTNTTGTTAAPAFSPELVEALGISFWCLIAAMVALLAVEITISVIARHKKNKQVSAAKSGAKKPVTSVLAGSDDELAVVPNEVYLTVKSDLASELLPQDVLKATDNAAPTADATDGQRFWQSKHFLVAAAFIFFNNAMPTASTQWFVTMSCSAHATPQPCGRSSRPPRPPLLSPRLPFSQRIITLSGQATS